MKKRNLILLLSLSLVMLFAFSSMAFSDELGVKKEIPGTAKLTEDSFIIFTPPLNRINADGSFTFEIFKPLNSEVFYLSGSKPTITASAKIWNNATGQQVTGYNFKINLDTRADMQLTAPADGSTYSKRLSGVNINNTHYLNINHDLSGGGYKAVGSGNITYYVH